LSPSFFIIVPIFLFALGACIGSFLNVVVWRLPRGESLVTPPSHCPRCNNFLKWYDNLPILGWLKLGGKCRYCKQPISMRYPIVEAITGLLFLGYYLLFFVAQIGPIQGVTSSGEVLRRPLSIVTDWPLYFLDMLLLSGLLAASLIDAELFIIPIEIPWLITFVAFAVHACYDEPLTPGGLCAAPIPAALSAGAGMGTLASYLLWATGRLRPSFAEGAPLMEIDRERMEKQQARDANAPSASRPGGGHSDDESANSSADQKEWTSAEVRREIRWEMLFLMPALVLGAGAVLLVWKVPAIEHWWARVASIRWFSALLGAVLGGLVGGFVVWLTRILGTIGFGREAMGMGDVHLMVAVGAVLGGGPAVVAFFLAPFFGIAIAIYMLLTGTKRELPYGPYLSLASAFVMLFYAPITAYLSPGVNGAGVMLRSVLGG
jgi:leader peptidase (prepilin peptidase)/N-methyltransferase